MWKEQLATLRQWREPFDPALNLVQSDRGAPEDFSLEQLVRDLAKIWDRYADRPFSNTKKGRMLPGAFAHAICRIAEPHVTDAQIQTAIRDAVRKIPGPRRGRKSQRSKTD